MRSNGHELNAGFPLTVFKSYVAPALLPIVRKQVEIVDAHEKNLIPMTRSPYWKEECGKNDTLMLGGIYTAYGTL